MTSTPSVTVEFEGTIDETGTFILDHSKLDGPDTIGGVTGFGWHNIDRWTTNVKLRQNLSGDWAGPGSDITTMTIETIDLPGDIATQIVANAPIRLVVGGLVRAVVTVDSIIGQTDSLNLPRYQTINASVDQSLLETEIDFHKSVGVLDVIDYINTNYPGLPVNIHLPKSSYGYGDLWMSSVKGTIREILSMVAALLGGWWDWADQRNKTQVGIYAIGPTPLSREEVLTVGNSPVGRPAYTSITAKIHHRLFLTNGAEETREWSMSMDGPNVPRFGRRPLTIDLALIDILAQGGINERNRNYLKDKLLPYYVDSLSLAGFTQIETRPGMPLQPGGHFLFEGQTLLITRTDLDITAVQPYAIIMKTVYEVRRINP